MTRFVRSIILCLGVWSGVAHAQSPATQPTTTQTLKPAPAELLAKVQADLQAVETVQANFVQTKDLSLLKHRLTIHGHFALEKPDRVIWIITDPVKYAIRVFGDEVRQWDEDTNKVQVIHLGGDPTFKAISEQIQAWFMGNYAALAENYDVSVAGENPLSLVFVPKAGSMVGKLMGRVEVTFDNNGQYIQKMVVTEAGGDVTTLDFKDPKVNEPVKPTTWEIPPHDR